MSCRNNENCVENVAIADFLISFKFGWLIIWKANEVAASKIHF